MTKTTSASIQLLNRTYKIKCPEGEESNLQLAAKKLDEQLQQNKTKFKRLDELQNFLLAALHISHELVVCQNQQNQQRQQITQFVNALENQKQSMPVESSAN